MEGRGETVRLVITKENPPAKGDRYATLSHCWGSAQFLQLTRSNLQSFQKGIKLEDLSKIFQDAVAATRMLGVRYLWIDSLCICQDQGDRSDWLTEAGLMAKVYSHSLCNLMATGTPADAGGLFSYRAPAISVNTANLKATDLGLKLRSRTG